MSERLDRAICYAVDAHRDNLRKVSNLPYIVHPMEVCSILSLMNADEDLMIAGLLHDTVEEAGVRLDEIEQLFGSNVRELINEHTEDKSRSWQERKQKNLDILNTADYREKLLILADLVSNLRSMHHDYRTRGDALFSYFHAGKESLAWYYRSCRKELADLAEDAEAAPFFQEFSMLCDSLFSE
jgi:(p)ppGpp synthase/HD superfamily hydrolase